jgi:hypothetical protein
VASSHELGSSAGPDFSGATYLVARPGFGHVKGLRRSSGLESKGLLRKFYLDFLQTFEC